MYLDNTFSDWADPHSLPGAPRVVPRPMSYMSTMSIGVTPADEAYTRSIQTQKDYAKAFPTIEAARIMTAPAMITAPAQAAAMRQDAASLGTLRAAQSQATVLKARTKNLQATAEVSKEMQQPVKAEAIKALPYAIGGLVALTLLGVILYRTRKN